MCHAMSHEIEKPESKKRRLDALAAAFQWANQPSTGTTGAATPAVVALAGAALPRSGGVEQRRGDVAPLAYVAEFEGAA